jgi:hypothetical protein
VEYLIQHVLGLEVGEPARQVYVAAREEAALFVEHDADAPTVTLDTLSAAATRGLTTRGFLGTVYPR